ncbi:hypothetical protein PT974_00848 [Cladobotryum mycophilum]|uniref:Uncharacterized protein n=1 Tax=Cladobotryum mycophilum TaxID=491253 RepID=A0ABR0T297_9HYPO
MAGKPQSYDPSLGRHTVSSLDFEVKEENGVKVVQVVEERENLLGITTASHAWKSDVYSIRANTPFRVVYIKHLSEPNSSVLSALYGMLRLTVNGSIVLPSFSSNLYALSKLTHEARHAAMGWAYQNLSSKTRLGVGIAVLAWGTAGLYISDRAEEKFGYTPTEQDKENLRNLAPKIITVEKGGKE